MPSFQINVLISAVILFAFSTFVYVYMVKNKESKKKWPPNIAMCPDYWNIDGKNCIPTEYNLGILQGKEPINTVVYNIKTPKGRNKIENWTKHNKIMWDGITVE